MFTCSVDQVFQHSEMSAKQLSIAPDTKYQPETFNMGANTPLRVKQDKKKE